MTFLLGECQIKAHLRKRGWTQVQLADKTGLSKQLINDYTNNRRPMHLLHAKVIAYTLGCYIDDLYIWIYVKR